jgi:hypothetical protein
MRASKENVLRQNNIKHKMPFKNYRSAVGVAQEVEHLPSKCEALKKP